MAYQTFTFDNPDSVVRAIDLISKLPLDKGFSCVIENKNGQRTLKQNKALHLYCTRMASALNEAGYDQRTIFAMLKEGFYIPWTMEAYKHIFRKVGNAMYPEVESTADLDTKEIQEVYLAVDRRFSELVGIRAEWPSIESQQNEAMGLVR